jgi:peptide chain release factor subunit 1
MRELIRRLAHLEPTDVPVLSVYLDMRPHGTEPALRPALLFLKERLRAIEKTLWPRGVAYDSVRADAARIARYLDDVLAEAQGVALFTCAAGDLFETVAVGLPFENQVVAAPVPDFVQQARLLDEQETVVVAVVDTNTARIFVTRMGYLDEMGAA